MSFLTKSLNPQITTIAKSWFQRELEKEKVCNLCHLITGQFGFCRTSVLYLKPNWPVIKIYTYLLLVIRITLFTVRSGGNFITTGKGVRKKRGLSSLNYKTIHICKT